MTTARTFIHAIALAAVFFLHAHMDLQVSGMRRAMQTLAAQSQIEMTAPAMTEAA